MIKLSYEQAVSRIMEFSGLSESEINGKVDDKLRQFSGLVSKEGAAHILANELGIRLIDNSAAPAKIKVKDLMPGMQNVEVLTKVLAVYPAREFNTNGRSGKVGSALVGDETGVVRGVFWNEQASKLGFISKGDILKLNGVYVKENRSGQAELHFNDRSSLVSNPPGESVEVQELARPRKKIGEIADTDAFVETVGTVIEVFDLRFFEVCSQCGKRARPDDSGNFICQQHGAVKPDYSYVMNVFLDDGTASVRVVFFRNAAQSFLKKTNEELLSYRENPAAFEDVKTAALGSFIRINARVSKNEMYGRIELIANSVEESTPEEAKQEASAAGGDGNQQSQESKVGTEKLQTESNN